MYSEYRLLQVPTGWKEEAMFTLLNGQVAKEVQADRIRAAERYRLASSTRAASVEAPERTPAPRSPDLVRVAGASAASRVGGVIEVGATSAVGSGGRVEHLGDAYEQTRQALKNVSRILRTQGVDLDDVVRTRVFLKKTWQWEEVGRAHAEVFGSTHPVTTFVGAGALIDPDALVQIEATAVARS